MRLGSDSSRWREIMLADGTNALALVRFGGFRLMHGGGGGGFAWLLIGLAAIGVAVWAVSRPGRTEAAKD
jgi:hypothetical protein